MEAFIAVRTLHTCGTVLCLSLSHTGSFRSTHVAGVCLFFFYPLLQLRGSVVPT